MPSCSPDPVRGTAGGRPSLVRSPSVLPFLSLTVLAFTGFTATLAALPAIAVDQGASPQGAGLVTTVMLGATVAAQLLVPVTTARLGTRPILALGLVLLGAPSLLLLLRPELPLLLAANAVRGTGFAVVTVVGSVLTARLAPAGRHGEMVGLYGLAVAVPNLAVVPGAVWLAQTVGVGPVAALAAAPLLGVPLVGRLEPAAVAQDPPSPSDAPAVLRRAVARAVLGPAGVLLAVTLAGGALLAYLPIERPAGRAAPLGLLLLGLTAALARWRVGPLADRTGSGLLLPAGALAGAAGTAICALGLALEHDVLLLTGAAVFGIGYGVVQNLTLVLAFARAGDRGVPLASAVWNAGYDTGTALGPLVMALLTVSGLAVAGATGVVAGVLLLVLPLAVASGRSRAATPAPAAGS